MCVWTSRRDACGATSFINYSPRAIEILLPPGSEPAGRVAARNPLAEGLWTLARWPRNEDTLVDIDEPLHWERLRTVVVLAHVGDALRDEVAEAMQQQLRYAWMLCDPQPAQLAWRMDGLGAMPPCSCSSAARSTRRSPGKTCGALQELPAADLPDHYEQFLLMLPGGGHKGEAVAGARNVTTWLVVLALARVLLARLGGRRNMTIGDVSEYLRPAKSHGEESSKYGPNQRPDAPVTPHPDPHEGVTRS